MAKKTSGKKGMGPEKDDRKNVVSVPVELFEEMIEGLMNLKGEREWWRNEPRSRLQEQFLELEALIQKAIQFRDRRVSGLMEIRDLSLIIANNLMKVDVPGGQTFLVDNLALRSGVPPNDKHHGGMNMTCVINRVEEAIRQHVGLPTG